MDLVLKVPLDQLEDGNDPILAHAVRLFAEVPADHESVTFGVQYELADAASSDRWSSVDIVTVTRGGQISA